MMHKAVAIAVVCALAGTPVMSRSAETDAPALTQSLSQEQAVERARELLIDQLKLSASDLVLENVEARTWNDASMGCGAPGTMALQVITPGYAVTFAAPERQYRVHVSRGNAMLCGQPVLMNKEVRRSSHARNLDVMIEMARKDLAARLKADPAAIRIAGTQSALWADTTMECPRPGEQASKGDPIRGFRISLSYQGRAYMYHSDMQEVRACPPIENE